MGKIARNAFTIVGWTATSCGLTLAVLLPANLQATSPVETAKLEITQPKFVTNGVELSMRADESGLVTLIAVNTTDQPATAQATFECKSFSMADRSSRVPKMQTSWTSERSIALGPGETKQVKLDRTISAGETIYVTTAEITDGVMLLSQLKFKRSA